MRREDSTTGSPFELSRRVARLEQSEIRNMSIECDRLGGINLAQGVCDTEVPLLIRRAVATAVEEGINSYTRYDGLASLREAIAVKLRADNDLSVDPEKQITVSAGATGAFYATCLALLNPGDEVIVLEPYYGYHVSTLRAVEAVPRFVRTRPPDWSFDVAELAAAIGPRTRAIIINTPANPSGKVFTRAELDALSTVVEAHDLLVFTDEIYEYFLYDGRTHVSPGALPALAERTVTISGFSKTFSITGWRIGYSVAPPEVARRIGYMSDLVYVCAPAPLQQAVAIGLRDLDNAFYADLAAEYADKRDVFCAALEGAGLTPYVPQGAYYVLADVSRLPGGSSKERAMHLLRTAGVGSVPGEAFYSGGGGEDLVRFCFAKTDDELAEACRRLQRLR